MIDTSTVMGALTFLSLIPNGAKISLKYKRYYTGMTASLYRTWDRVSYKTNQQELDSLMCRVKKMVSEIIYSSDNVLKLERIDISDEEKIMKDKSYYDQISTIIMTFDGAMVGLGRLNMTYQNENDIEMSNYINGIVKIMASCKSTLEKHMENLFPDNIGMKMDTDIEEDMRYTSSEIAYPVEIPILGKDIDSMTYQMLDDIKKSTETFGLDMHGYDHTTTGTYDDHYPILSSSHYKSTPRCARRKKK